MENILSKNFEVRINSGFLPVCLLLSCLAVARRRSSAVVPALQQGRDTSVYSSLKKEEVSEPEIFRRLCHGGHTLSGHDPHQCGKLIREFLCDQRHWRRGALRCARQTGKPRGLPSPSSKNPAISRCLCTMSSKAVLPEGSVLLSPHIIEWRQGTQPVQPADPGFRADSQRVDH